MQYFSGIAIYVNNFHPTLSSIFSISFLSVLCTHGREKTAKYNYEY